MAYIFIYTHSIAIFQHILHQIFQFHVLLQKTAFILHELTCKQYQHLPQSQWSYHGIHLNEEDLGLPIFLGLYMQILPEYHYVLVILTLFL